MAAASAAVAALRRSKSALRKQVATVLKSLSADTIADQSARVADALKTVPEFVASKAVFTFLSMPDEVQTWATVSGLFVDGKRVFVPRVVGKRAMAVLEVESAARLSSLTENSWGIPEPPAPLIEPFHEGETAEALTKATADDPELDWSRVAGDASHVAAKHGAKGVIDVVLMPGLAFDRQGRRCGHGRGYYDTFLERITKQYAAMGAPSPWLIAICLEEQLQHEPVPVDAHDYPVDIIVTPLEVVRASPRATAALARDATG